MSSVRKSLVFSALDSYLGLVLSIASTAVIARILTPEQTGVFAVAAVFASLASTFRDFGVAEYLIQERELTDAMVRAALSVNIAISWVMAVLLFVLAPLAADFYRSPGVAQVMQVQSVNFLLIPFGAVTMALFRREMDMKPIFIAGLLANLATFVVSVTLALRGFGYMSLAWSSLANVVVTVAVSVWLRPPHFSRWPGLRGIGRVVQFGKFASGVYIFGQAGRGAPEMIIGRAQDMAAVGMFSRGNGLVEIFHRLVLRAMLPICLPYFARGVRESGSPRRGMLHAMSLLTGVGWPFLLCIALGAFAAVRLMYGPQWVGAVPIARLLCLAAAIELTYFTAKEALLAMGLVRESNRLQVGLQAMRVVGLLAVLPFGLVGACWGLSAAALGGLVYAHASLKRPVGINVRDVWRAVASSAVVSLVTATPLAAWLMLRNIDESNYIQSGSVGAATSLVAWLMALRLTGHPLWHEARRAGGLLDAKLRGLLQPL